MTSIDLPLRWRKPRRIFVNSLSDPWHEAVPDEWIDRIFAVMALAPQHTFQLLTKRADRMHDYMRRLAASIRPLEAAARQMGRTFKWEHGGKEYPLLPWPIRNIHLGVSCEDQDAADERVVKLLETPAALRFVSAEPLLGPIDFTRVDCRTGARPCDVAWIGSIIEQCRAASVPCFVKQLGAYAVLDPRYDRSIPGATRRLRDRKGADPEEWPALLRVQESPVQRGDAAGR